MKGYLSSLFSSASAVKEFMEVFAFETADTEPQAVKISKQS
jgi:hypothetical protein